jgi:hypothetical protein
MLKIFATTMLFTLISMSQAEKCAGPIQVGSHKQLFIDHKFIQASHNITLNVNPPLKNGINIRKEKPWETAAVGGGSLIQYLGKSRFYYWAYELSPDGKKSKGHFCYAESENGINWQKPALGQIEFEGSKDNNILDCEPGNVFIDPESKPEKRYKMLSISGSMSDKENCGLYIYYSADGIEWKKNPERLYPFYPDGINQIVYDDTTGKYMAYFRQWFPRSAGTYFTSAIKPLRTVGLQILDDPMKPWAFDEKIPRFYLWGENNLPTPSAEAKTILACDHHDPENTDLYTGVVHKYRWAQDVWLAFPSPYRQFPDPPHEALNDGLLDVQLAVSRDGINWTRYRTPYLRLGLEGTIDDSQGALYLCPGMVRNQNEIYQYYMGTQQSHGNKELGLDWAKNFRCTQRLDGFVSADAPYQGGEFTTPLLRFEGKNLQLNVDTSALGQVQVEILDANDCPIEGYSLQEADLIQGNFINKTVSWGGTKDLSSLIGQDVKIHFVMKSAKLYSFQFVN